MGHFREAEVGTLAGVCRHDVVDDDSVVRRGHPAELQHLLLGPQARVDIEADAVEVAVDGRGELAAAQATGTLHWTVVDALHAEFGERTPEAVVAEGLEYRAAFRRDDGRRIGGEPHRGDGAGIARAGLGIRPLPETRLAGVMTRPLAGRMQHGLADQPFDIGVVWDAHRRSVPAALGKCRRLSRPLGHRCIGLACCGPSREPHDRTRLDMPRRRRRHPTAEIFMLHLPSSISGARCPVSACCWARCSSARR